MPLPKTNVNREGRLVVKQRGQLYCECVISLSLKFANGGPHLVEKVKKKHYKYYFAK